MHRATIFIHYELMNVGGLLLPSRMPAEVDVTERCGSDPAGTAFVHGTGRVCKSFSSFFCAHLGLTSYFKEFKQIQTEQQLS